MKLFEQLKKAGYVPQKQPFNAMCNALFMASPILLEGYRGGGKTAFPEALAQGLNLPIFTLSMMIDTTTDHILSSWDRAAQQQFVSQEALKGASLEKAMERQWSFNFLKMGEALDAFHHSVTSGIPSVLLVDEIDKSSSDVESAFLQLFARGYVNVPQLRPDPRIGFIPEIPAEKRWQTYPIIVLTSNDMRPLSSPLRSRARYCFIPAPTIEEMAEILVVKVPQAQPRLVFQTIKLINGINGLPLLEKPALREFIMLLETFVAYGYTFITANGIGENIDCLAKTKKDVLTMIDAVDSLFTNYVEKADAHLENLIRNIFEKRFKEQKIKEGK